MANVRKKLQHKTDEMKKMSTTKAKIFCLTLIVKLRLKNIILSLILYISKIRKTYKGFYEGLADFYDNVRERNFKQSYPHLKQNLLSNKD